MTRRFALTPDQLRLVASLGFNFLGKAPGVVAVFVILPLVSRSLGTAAYGELLSAMALGSLFTLPFGGINTVGRRILATAFGAKDRVGQANAFMTTTVLMATVGIAASALMAGATASSWSKPVFIFASLLPILVQFFNTFDNARASFNEHYVTAAFQLISQIVIYSCVYVIGLPPGGVIPAALALQSPFLLASAATLVALLIQRPYLGRGKVTGVRQLVAPTLGVVLADGALGSLLNLSVYWLKAAGSAEMAAWVGTFLRLFQSFLAPALLILFPLTTYISMRWAQMTPQRQIVLYKVFILAGLTYGLLVGCAMAFGGPLYINHMFKLTAHGDNVDVLAMSLFLGAIVAQKSYTMLLYAVSEARFVSFGTAVISAVGIGAAALSSHWLSPMRVIDVLFVSMGIGLPALFVVADLRYKRERRDAVT
ncbi:MAG TPA: hypothetical protein VNY32_06095 [Candidatus Acidoferrales bacterium]|nr:hypothetical protein [Candidatus Acidoferrales bacterium]